MLISLLTSSLHQNIKKKGSGLVIPICFVFILGGVFLSSVFIYRTSLNYHYRNIDNALTDALLAGAVIDLKEYAITGNIIIPDALTPGDNTTYIQQSYQYFKQNLKEDLPLTEGRDDIKKYSGFKIKEYIIFNVVNGIITAYRFDTALGSYHKCSTSELHGLIPDGAVATSDGPVKITKTSIYAEIGFSLKVRPFFAWMDNEEESRLSGCHLSRCVAVTNN